MGDQETTADKSARQTATQPQTKLKGWPDPACPTNVSPYKHFGWSSWVNSRGQLSQDNQSMRDPCFEQPEHALFP